MNIEKKEEFYKKLLKQVNSLLEDVNDEVAMMSSIVCLTIQEFDYYFWAGFYRIWKKEQLIIGPYQGTLGCLFINFGKGVCGVCAHQEKTIIVPDVHKFDGHIACDSNSNSEIVVPVFNKNKDLIAVFDVDSTEFSSFDETDKKYLEEILTIFQKL